jgi:hypothetical protein
VCTVCLGKKYIEIEEENKIRKILEDNWSSKSK